MVRGSVGVKKREGNKEEGCGEWGKGDEERRGWEKRERDSLLIIGLVIERSRVRVPAGTTEEFFSFFFSLSTFCADSYFGSGSTAVTALAH